MDGWMDGIFKSWHEPVFQTLSDPPWGSDPNRSTGSYLRRLIFSRVISPRAMSEEGYLVLLLVNLPAFTNIPWTFPSSVYT